MVQASSDAEAHQLLKREILSLGGDLDDFELLKQVEDGEEEEWRPKKPTQGQDTFDDSEFKKFFAKLDFAAAKKSIEGVKESEDGEDETVEEDEEEEEEQEPVSYLDVSEKLIASVSKAKIIPKKFSLIRFEEEQTWYEARDDFVSEQRIPEGSEEKSLDKNGKFIRVLRERAEKLLKNEGEVGAAKERKFFQMAAESGTQKDKVAAMVLKVQNAPVSNYAILEQLVKIVRKRVRREFVLASSHVKDLFLSSILPCTRPLREFHENTELLLFAAENVDTQDGSKALLFAIYEDYAKKQFGFFLDGLDEVLSDPIEEMKIVSLQIIKTLLEEQPEAEGRLLSLNKIGDPKKKVVDRASKFITDLLFKHPNMQEVVGYEIENFLWRSNQSDASVLAGINLLNQFVFSSDRHEVPSRLIRVYFQFFQSEIAKNQKKNKKTELSQKILFSLLTGVNRAFPYVTTGDDADLDVHINNTFSLVHQGTFTVALQALSFLFQAFNSREELGDRFYNSLYRLLLRPELGAEQKRHTVLLNLLYRTLSEDKNVTRGKSFLKRVLSICHASKTPFQAGSLVFVGHLLNERPVWKSLACAQEGPQTAIGGLDQLKDSKFEDEDSDEEEHFVDADKQDKEETRKKSVSDQEKSKGWHHREKVSRSNFDPWARNPSYSNVDGEKAWELVSMANHFHPSVSLFAKNVIAGGDEKYPGDPLNDFTIMRFLDRFVYKNPKAERKAPRSVNQRRVNKYLDTHQLPVTSLEFLQAKEHELGPHDRFMQKFFQMRASGVTSKAKEDQDIDDVDDDEFDKILDGDLRGWENRVGKIDSTLATPKQRKAMKKRGDLEELEDLDDDDVDFGDLYSDEENEEEEEINPELIEDYDGILSDDDEDESPTKRVKLAKLEQDAEQVGDLLDDAGILSKQEQWEQGRNKKKGGKNNLKSKGPRKRAGKMKSSKKR